MNDDDEHEPAVFTRVGRLGLAIAVGVALILAACGLGVWALVTWFANRGS